MTDLYREKGYDIQFKTSPSGFMITLPNLNHAKETPLILAESSARSAYLPGLLEEPAETAVTWIQANGLASRMDLETVWGIGRSAATIWIDSLMKAGVLIRHGGGRNTSYAIGKRGHPRSRLL